MRDLYYTEPTLKIRSVERLPTYHELVGQLTQPQNTFDSLEAEFLPDSNQSGLLNQLWNELSAGSAHALAPPAAPSIVFPQTIDSGLLSSDVLNTDANAAPPNEALHVFCSTFRVACGRT